MFFFYPNPLNQCDSEEPFRGNLGRLALDRVGIIFRILALYCVLSTLLRFGLGNSVGLFFFSRDIRAS